MTRFSTTWCPPPNAVHANECYPTNPTEGQVWECVPTCPALMDFKLLQPLGLADGSGSETKKSPEQHAVEGMTDGALGDRLDKLATSIRRFDVSLRTAILRESARRLGHQARK